MTRTPLSETLSTTRVSNILNLIASLIGIFGFITGISSLPLLITSSDQGVNAHRQAVWFGSAIPLSISIPVFSITLLFVYGLFFLMLIRINRWLYRIHVISSPHRYSWDNSSGDNFSVMFFVVLGAAIGALVARAFFDFSITPGVDERSASAMAGDMAVGILVGVPLFLWFLFSLCVAARDAAARLEAQLEARLKHG